MATILNVNTLETDAKTEGEIGEEQLKLTDCSMWLNNMPSFNNSVRRPHISVKVTRTALGDEQTVSAVAPRVRNLHVIRTNATDGSSLLAADTEDPRTYHVWATSPIEAAASTSEEVPDMTGQYFVIRGPGSGEGPLINVCGWNGPSWPGTDVEYEAFVEFEDGLLLRSGKQELLVVS